MKRLLLVVIVLLSAVADFSGQTQKSPTEVVEQYLKMVEDGALLSSDGWNKVSILFSEPSPQPKNNVFFVTSKHHGVGEVSIKGNRAEVHDAWWNQLGSVDAALHYAPPVRSNSEGTIGIYHLVLTDRHWESGADGVAREVTGPLHWEIEGPLTRRWTTVDTAIHYIAEMRDKSTDPVIKHNADRAIATLKRHSK